MRSAVSSVQARRVGRTPRPLRHATGSDPFSGRGPLERLYRPLAPTYPKERKPTLNPLKNSWRIPESPDILPVTTVGAAAAAPVGRSANPEGVVEWTTPLPTSG